MKAVWMTVALFLVGTPVFGGELRCPKERVTGLGVDQSLPCYFHSPLPHADGRVMFGRGSHRLDDKAKAVLDRQAEILRRYPDLAFTIWGHLDHEEAEAPNGQALGFERARVVRDYLVLRGIAPDRITTDSRGDRAMIVKDRSEAGLAIMRYASTETEQ